MTQIIMTLSIIGTAMVVFAWNGVPPVAVAVCASLALYVTGILTMKETLAGFWRSSGHSDCRFNRYRSGTGNSRSGRLGGPITDPPHPRQTMRIVAIMIIAAVFSGFIGMNGAVAAMLPVAVVVAVRTGLVPSRILYMRIVLPFSRIAA